MKNALFAFEDAQRAQGAVQALLDAGVPAAAVALHRHVAGPHEHGLETADEFVTGGLLHNLVDLFEGVLDWGGSPHDAAAYAETIRRGGAVVSVTADQEHERLAADRTMAAVPHARRTPWADLPTA